MDRLCRCCSCGQLPRYITLLPNCLHSCCQPCAEKLLQNPVLGGEAACREESRLETSPVTCPACEQPAGAERFLPCPLLDAMMTSLGLRSPDACSVCCHAAGRVTTYHSEQHSDAPTNEAAIAVVWCNDCSELLCDGCSKYHRIFCPSHVKFALRDAPANAEADTATSAETGVPAMLHRCSNHGRMIEFFCTSCEDGLRCDRCIDVCLESQHCVNAIDSKKVRDAAELAAAELVKAAIRLRRKMIGVAGAVTAEVQAGEPLDELEAGLSALLQDDKARVWRGASAALSSITRTYDCSSAALHDAYDLLADRVPPTLPESAAKLRASLTRADAYVSALLDCGDSVCLLDQQLAVQSSLHRLDDAVAALPPLTADAVRGSDGSTAGSAAAWTLLHSEVPTSDFGAMVQRVVGLVRPRQPASTDASDSGVASAVKETPCEVPPTKNENELVTLAPSTDARASEQPSSDSGVSDAGKEESAAVTAQTVLSFGPAETSFRSVSACHDVAATPDGRILLAALGQGLKHYDASGRKLATWRPPSDDVSSEHGLVSSVDTLADGRVAVAVINARRVHVLRIDRSDGVWIQDRVYDLWLCPYRVATATSGSSDEHSCLAVVGAATEHPNGKTTQFGPGRDLVVMLLTSDRRDPKNGSTLLERKLDHLANAVTLLGGGRDIVVLAGEMLHGGKRLVEAYSYAAARSSGHEQPLWRYEITVDVGDVCAVPFIATAENVVYMAVPDRRNVQWLDTVAGKKTGVAMTAVSGSSSPNRLSFFGDGQGLRLVVLAARGCVTVHRPR